MTKHFCARSGRSLLARFHGFNHMWKTTTCERRPQDCANLCSLIFCIFLGWDQKQPNSKFSRTNYHELTSWSSGGCHGQYAKQFAESQTWTAFALSSSRNHKLRYAAASFDFSKTCCHWRWFDSKECQRSRPNVVALHAMNVQFGWRLHIETGEVVFPSRSGWLLEMVQATWCPLSAVLPPWHPFACPHSIRKQGPTILLLVGMSQAGLPQSGGVGDLQKDNACSAR